jgi:hypothetical protein
MAQNRNVELIVAELDDIAQALEAKGSTELASLVDEVSAELLTEAAVKPPKPAAPAKEPKAPKAAKGNNKRRKTQKRKKMAGVEIVSRAQAKKILKAAHMELVDIATELLKDKDLKKAQIILKYAEDVKSEEEDLDQNLPVLTDGDGMDGDLGEENLDGGDGDGDADDLDGMDGDLDGDGDGDADDLDGMDGDLDGDGDGDADDLEGGDSDLEGVGAGEGDTDDLEKEVDAMLRKYDLDNKNEPPTPPEPPKAPEAPEVPKAEDKPEDKSEDKPEDKDEGEEEDEDEEDDDDKPEDKGEGEGEGEGEDDKKTADTLYTLAQKLAAAGEDNLALALADLLDRQTDAK